MRLIAFCILTVVSIAYPAEITGFTLHEGAMIDESKKVGWTFRSRGKSEFYDLSAASWMMKPGAGRIAGLQQWGTVFESGRIVNSGELRREDLQNRKNFPVAVIFYGETAQPIKLNIYKPTEVVRAEVQLKVVEPYVLWQVLDTPTDVDGRKSGFVRADRSLESFLILSGVIEAPATPAGDYVFRPKVGKAEAFENVGADAKAIPGLFQVGLKLDNGAEIFARAADSVSPDEAGLREVARSYPGHKAVVRIFEGPARRKLELLIHGSTPVFCTHLRVSVDEPPTGQRTQKETPKISPDLPLAAQLLGEKPKTYREITLWTNRTDHAAVP
jgi:hypothetical protein